MESKMVGEKRAQGSIEFLLVVGMMIITFTVFLLFFNSRMTSVQEQNNYELLEDLGTVLKAEIDLATYVENGYSRSFYLPESLNGVDYEIDFGEGGSGQNKYTIFLVKYSDADINSGDYVFFGPADVTGQINKGNNNITKQWGKIKLNP